MSDSRGSSQLLAAIIRGLAKASLDDPVRTDAITIAQKYVSNEDLAASIASLVLAIMNADLELPTVDRDSLDSLAAELWNQHSETYEHPATDDWMSVGLNSWPGYLAQYWLERISRRINKDRPDVSSLSPEEAKAIQLFLEEQGPAGHGPLAIICNQRKLPVRYRCSVHLSKPFSAIQDRFARSRGSGLAFNLYSPRISSAMLDTGLWESLIAIAGNKAVTGNVRLRSQFWDLLSVVLLRHGIPSVGFKRSTP